MAFETINLGNQPTGTGGDTARSAFEKVNKNFITAEVLASSMSQAQFEAIRAQNNERYAASGFVHFGKHGQGSGDVAVNQGLYINPVLVNHMRLGRPDIQNAGGLSKTDYPEINIAGVIFDIKANSSAFSYLDIKLHSAPDGKTTYNKSTGANVVYATTTAAFNAAAVDVNAEVVTDRVDMWGFESFLEEVSATNPYVYPNGLIQSLATTMDGITTSASNRPITYYAWFAGDTGSKGKGVNYFTLTDAQKRKVLANHKNKLYFLDDGRLVQWRVRGRSFAGSGNGDFMAISSSGNERSLAAWNPSLVSTIVQPQGVAHVPNGNYITEDDTTRSALVSRNDPAIFYARDTTSSQIAVNGECYFLVCGTVNRLNQGFYHQSLNASGSVADNTGKFWYNTTLGFTSQAACFDSVKIGVDVTGRPDGRLSKYIYASGQGGVCRDMRYSANHTTLEKFAEADLKVKNGTYRGFEKLKFTPTRIPVKNVVDKGSYYQVTLGSDDKYIEGILNAVSLKTVFNPCSESIIRRTGLKIQVYGDSFASGNSLVINCAKTTDIIVGDDIFLPTMYEEIDFSVGGTFLQTDVIGAPSSILLTDALKNGWYGSWVPDLPAGGGKPHYGTRKNINVTGSPLLTSNNNGATWDSFPTGTQAASALNGTTGSYATTEIRICQYQAFAKQTEPTVNSVVYGGARGAGSVDTMSQFNVTRSVLLGESLLGLIGKNQGNPYGGNSTLLSRVLFDSKFVSGAYAPTHEKIILGEPTNNSKAFKTLNYNTETNQQAGINYAATELKHDGTDWGDDSQIHIVDNENTLTDLNGNTVKVVTHKLKEPIGWIKNTI